MHKPARATAAIKEFQQTLLWLSAYTVKHAEFFINFIKANPLQNIRTFFTGLQI